MQMRIRGGSMETGVKELTVKPCVEPSGARTVATVTPEANELHASRKVFVSRLPARRARAWIAALDKGITLILS
jgi:hypothetical protein